jgi:putative transposase
MSRFRRYFSENSPVFIAAVCHQRQTLLGAASHKELLLSVMREVKQEIAYHMLGYVLLDDHFHWVIVPTQADTFPKIMQSVKLRFVRRMLANNRSQSPKIWQRRYWDHIIRDEHDLHRHLDYIHYNPVRHNYRMSPAEYRWSSFREYQRRGLYAEGWGFGGEPDGCEGLVPE